MTATTTLKLPDELKARIAVVAQQSGKSAHAFMVEALELQSELAERRGAFVTDALYDYSAGRDIVIVLAVRHQREGGYGA